ncbi:bifunctional UDP-N-acetylglucosamine diphosphorylase/glucosamine-1-phosphate N-acetyltransferase GlmU [Herpetosiphon giganteus]|uniref:bifunctional UDP-N-acetylglucosamine diphosphorylase/glucosamine-1-phosphate N-acetyltransferase GlmU n=1 Tax=Herpetosiphon giganteus TaxID=2029754 RepID=UPI00195B5D8D|nr:bifunctional UDP-N-acetylglucosamine diphosphorylase/glucosamine-1-phosphate N-acetyltransferase GlmU [Herpetosiphon giganteus]MBM7842079.1 bifunctional UDP-N-acetylglucosamine pyrophosphorylase/glucosamine-1-phosphate N-acetyltransferase [Herpetosiphon giganteus]
MTLGVVVLAAGQGTRMRSSLPKVLHPVAGLPLVEHVTRLADAVGAQQIVLVVSEDTLAPISAAFGHRYRYVVQHERLGTGHAVAQARAELEGKVDEVLVLYGADPLMRHESLLELLAVRRTSNAKAAIVTFQADPPTGYGRIVRDEHGAVQAIVEERNASPEQRRITEVNQGVALYDGAWLWNALDQVQPNSLNGEYYLTDLVEIGLREQGAGAIAAIQLRDPDEALGVNDRIQLAQVGAILNARKLRALMLAGVSIVDPTSTFVDQDVQIGIDTTLLPGTILKGRTTIGANCTIGPNSLIEDSQIGEHCKISYSVVEQARMELGANIGPYGHLRRGAHLMEHVHMGNFGEVKNATLGPGTKMGHFSYIGDATIGENVNIGAGTITCNFTADGKKHRTEIGANAFIGSDSMLRAPVKIGEGAITGAGSVVTKDIPDGGVAVGMPARVIRHRKLEQSENE